MQKHSQRLLRGVVWAIVPLLVGLGAVIPLWTGNAAPATREIQLDASQFAFAPGRIEVNKGDTIVLTLQSDDVVHGFYLDGYGLETRVVPGVSQQITFVADQPGKFRYRCAVSCGPLHPFMIGEMVVRPNAPFWQVMILLVFGLAGVMGFILFAGLRESDKEL